jgi:hypothetical protein
VRLSIGIEHVDDLIGDIEQAHCVDPDTSIPLTAYSVLSHPPPSAFAKSTMEIRDSRAAAMRSVSAASSVRCASSTSRYDVRPALVAQAGDGLGLLQLVAPGRLRGEHVRSRRVGDERIVHFAKRGLQRLLIFHGHLVATSRRRSTATRWPSIPAGLH